VEHVAEFVATLEVDGANPGVEALPVQTLLDGVENVAPNSILDGCTHGSLSRFFSLTTTFINLD
jgi:hypothetical protein